jgi:hypothetical protein
MLNVFGQLKYYNPMQTINPEPLVANVCKSANVWKWLLILIDNLLVRHVLGSAYNV